MRGQDVIVLDFEANRPLAGEDGFVVIGITVFDPGQVRYEAAGANAVLVPANVDNDVDAEFAPLVQGTTILATNDFVF